MPRYDFGSYVIEQAQIQDAENLRNGLYRIIIDNKVMEMANTTPTGKIEVTSEMVQRAYDAVPDKLLFRSTVKDMLDAALNPPEPEIVVTEEMRLAGCRTYANTAYGGNSMPSEWMMGFVSDIYRTMRKLEPKA